LDWIGDLLFLILLINEITPFIFFFYFFIKSYIVNKHNFKLNAQENNNRGVHFKCSLLGVKVDLIFYHKFYNNGIKNMYNIDRLYCRNICMISMSLYVINNTDNTNDKLSIKI